MNRRTVLILTTVLIFSATGIERAAAVLKTNTWSIAFYHAYRDKSQPAAELERFPEQHDNAARWLAMYALGRGNPGLAQRYLERSGTVDDPESLIVLGMALAEQGDLEGAITTWEKSGYEKELLIIARDACDRGDFETCARVYRSAWRINPAAVTDEYLAFLSNSYRDPESFSLVLEELLEGETQLEARTGWLLILGDFFFEEKVYDQAIRAYRAVQSIEPDNFRAAFNLGRSLFYLGNRFEPAVEAIQQAIRIDPENAQAYFTMGQILIQAEAYAEADPWLVQAIELAPEERWYWYERGRIAYLAGNLGQSEAAFIAAIEQFPGWAPPLFDLALTFRDLGRFDDALFAIDQAIQFIDPPDARYYIRKARIHVLLEQTADAIEAYKLALELEPTNDDALYELYLLEEKGAAEDVNAQP